MAEKTGNPGYNRRRAELAQIHIGAEALGMDTKDPDPSSDYRSMLWTVGRVHTSSDLDYAGRQSVLAHLKSRGWKNKPAIKAKTSRRLASDEVSKKIRALWIELRDAGALKDSSEAALNAYVHRITKVSALEWLSWKQASLVIETLKKWLERVGEQA